MIALSIRQPWAWLVVNGHKDIENRVWPSKYRGRLLIHAGKEMTPAEWYGCWEMVRRISPEIAARIPGKSSIERGGIVGCAVMTDMVEESRSPWFVGPFGFVMSDARPLAFRPCHGALGFFKVPADVEGAR